MPHLDKEKLDRMRRSYMPNVVSYLQGIAMIGRTLTYSELTEKFGRGPRLWGDPLGGITLKCKELGVPLLPVLFVNKATGKPSLGAVLYQDLGLVSDEDIRLEKEKCFSHQWSKLWEDRA